MNHLPLETLQQIFELACTDGGYTGCSLALISKLIHEVARSTRFHSVILVAKAQRLGAFVALYQNQCLDVSDIRPRICHLHLSIPSAKQTGPSSTPTEEGEGDEESEDDDQDEDGPPDAAQLLAVQHLLSLIADDLQSLVITKRNLKDMYPLFVGRAFPSLKHLTLVLHRNACHRLVAQAPASPAQPLFPALTHLHLVDPDWTSPVLRTWSSHAPRVTHLRISAHCLFGKFVDELPDAVGSPQYPFKRGLRLGRTIVGPPPAVRKYPSLARVVVQPGPRPPSGPCGSNRVVFSSRVAQLEWLAARATARARGTALAAEMYALPPCSWTEDEWDEAIRTEWLRRIAGEVGRDWFCGAEEDGYEDEDVE